MASIAKQPNGRYKVRYRTPEGKDRAARFDLLGKAREFVHQLESDKSRGRFVDTRAGQVPFGDFAEQVYAARLHLRPATRSRDESHLRNHLLPAFGSKPLARIDKKSVQTWIRALSDDNGLAPRTVRECYRILGGIMREAVEDRLIPESPCRRVALPRVENFERRFLTAEQVETLADATDSRYRALVYVGAYLGLRWGELAGLKRVHLDMLRRQVRVVGSLERVGNGFRYVEETKTVSGRRMVPVPAFLVDELAHHLADAPESAFVFPAPKGGHLFYQSWRHRFWNPAATRAGFEGFTPHELRHTTAALMIDQGANPLTVQRRLGHKDIRTTLQLYGHLFPEQDDMLTGRLDELRERARVSKVCPDEIVRLPVTETK
jgi:integrase